jgi:hypothetical protein
MADTDVLDQMDLRQSLKYQARKAARSLTDPKKRHEFLQSARARRSYVGKIFLSRLEQSIKETVKKKIPYTMKETINTLRHQLELLYLISDDDREKAEGHIDELEILLLRSMDIDDDKYDQNCTDEDDGEDLLEWRTVRDAVWQLYLILLPFYIRPLSGEAIPLSLVAIITACLRTVSYLKGMTPEKVDSILQECLMKLGYPALKDLWMASGFFFTDKGGPFDEGIMHRIEGR